MRIRQATVMTAVEAADLIHDGQTVAISGNGAGMISAEAVFEALERKFLQTGHPRDLTLVHSLGLGDREALGTNRFAHEGMVRKVIAAHFTWSPRMQQLVRDEKVEAYCLPGGVIQQLLREIGAGRPGLFTRTGLGTFVDPRHGGGQCNRRSREEVVALLQVDGQEVLHYKPFTVDVAVPTDGKASVDMMMPVWSPGFYGLQNYAQRVSNVTASASDGTKLDVTTPTTSRWTIATGGR